MFKTSTTKPTLALSGALLAAALIASYHVEAVAADAIHPAVVDAHDQARRLLQQPHVAGPVNAMALPTSVIARAAVPDGQEQARRLLAGAGTSTADVVEVDDVTFGSGLVTADAHTLAERLLAGPASY